MNSDSNLEARKKGPRSKLTNAYPSIYGQGFSFCVPDEWLATLNTLSIRINTVLANHPPFSIQVSDVKEKFGELRFYYTLTGPEAGYQEVDQKIESLIEQVNNDLLAIGMTRGC